MIRVQASSINPVDGVVESPIVVQVAPGSIHFSSETFVTGRASFKPVSAAGPEIQTEATVMDEGYTQFFIRVPEGLIENVNYAISIVLFSHNGPPTEEYLIESDSITFHVMHNDQPLVLDMITPSVVSRGRFDNTTLHVTGHKLGQLNHLISPVLQGPMNITLKYVLMSNDFVTLVPVNLVNNIKTGSYRIRFTDQHNEIHYARTRLTIIE